MSQLTKGKKMRIFKLNKEMENCDYCNVTKSDIDNPKVRADLGAMVEDEEGNKIFQSRYGNGFILKLDIKDYEEPVEEVI